MRWPIMTLLFLTLSLTGCGNRDAGSTKSVAAISTEMTTSLKEITEILESVKDETTAKEAARKLRLLAPRHAAVYAEYEGIFKVKHTKGGPEDAQALEASLWAMEAFDVEANRVFRIPNAWRHFEAVFQLMKRPDRNED